jgi:hypothetical protein
MRFELWLILITGFIILYIYYDGIFIKNIFKYTKQLKIGGVIFAALTIYFLFKHNPQKVKELIENHNDFISYLPIDKNTQSMLNPVLDMTKKNMFLSDEQLNINNPIVSFPEKNVPRKVKRSVSESLKKYTASSQGWKCNICKNTLNATFQVDHIIRLEHGGTNDRNNLQAVCVGCHSSKTLMENF